MKESKYYIMDDISGVIYEITHKEDVNKYLSYLNEKYSDIKILITKTDYNKWEVKRYEVTR